jgi:hypothetical protein
MPQLFNILFTTDAIHSQYIHNTFTIHVLNLITVQFLLFIKPQFTTRSKCSVPNSMHSWTRLITERRTLSKVVRFDRYEKCVAICRFIFNWSWIYWGLCLHRYKHEGLVSRRREDCTSRTGCGHSLIRNVFLLLVWGTQSCSLSKHFRLTLYNTYQC